MSYDHWRTPPDVLERIFAVLGDVDLDPCASADEEHQFAAENWSESKLHVNFHNRVDMDEKIDASEGKRVFANPPYSKLSVWVPFLASLGGPTIALIPPSVGTSYWHEDVFNSRKDSGAQAVCFVRGRISFLDADGQPARQNRYESAFVLWRAPTDIYVRFFDLFSEVGKVVVP